MGPLVLLVAMLAAVTVADRKMSIAEKLTEDADLSQFLALLSRNAVANTSLHYRQMTLFAPTNEAFQRYNGEMDDNLVLYHISNLATTLTNIDYAISSELDGNPPLWVTRRRDATHDDLYVNNAKVLVARSYQTTNSNNKRQVLHVIDQVLQPLQPHGPVSLSSPVYSPNAFQFLEHSDLFNIGQHRLRSFRQKVNQLHKKEVFNADGKHTFFIPVDEGFKPTTRSDLIDAKVVDGHVIPHHVLFTQATPDTREFETLAFGDNVKVIVSFSTAMNGQEEITYVKSNTVAGDAKHSRGVVLADIVRANIPVKNGVVHLIQRPLMVVDTSVIDFLKEKEDGPLCKFYEVILDLGNNNQFLNELNTAKDMTLFAPSNEAWNEPSVQNIVRNHQKLMEILNLHLVRERLAMDTIIHNNMNQIYQAPTAMHRKYLYFNVLTHNNNQTLTVEGGGVNATVTLPNIAATNGFVHIIDRVLGVPYTTIFEKLKTDPMLNITYNLGKREMFNQQLNDMEHRYTYFVPRDHAWLKFQVRHPSAFKALFKLDFGYYTKQILERHVIRASRSYTISELKLHANETHPFVMPTSRDPLRLRVKESDKNYYVEWNGHWIHVFRPDVECTNGIIHVIDEPFLLESDVRATGAAPALRLAHACALLLLSLAYTLTVEGGGVNATVTLPNIAATNGFVHIIDRVLGVPYTTIFEKLKTDPMLNITYNLGKREMFNQQLNDMEHRYTYFVPRDHAWLKFQVRHPSAFKALFKLDFGYYTKQILERHVIRASRSYTISELKLHANETHPFVMPTSRDPLRLRVKESDKNYYVEWNGHWIHVFRPDVECTNGIIHVIDEPFLLESDVRATGAAPALAHACALLLLSLAYVRILE